MNHCVERRVFSKWIYNLVDVIRHSPGKGNKSYHAVPDEHQMTGTDVQGFKDLEKGEMILGKEV